MSKLMNELNRIDESRRAHNNIIVDDTPEQPAQAQVHVVKEHKVIYVIAFLVVVLVALSVVSMSASLKTFSQLENAELASSVVLKTLAKQSNAIQSLEALITDKNSEELARIDELRDQMKELNVVMMEREKGIMEMAGDLKTLKNSMEDSVDDLKMSDRLMLKKYITLNTRVRAVEGRELGSWNINN